MYLDTELLTVTEVRDTPAQAIIRAARQQITDPSKWRRGNYAYGNTGMCLVDAFAAVTWQDIGLFLKIPEFLQVLGFDSTDDAARWNERSTHEQVLARMDAALR